MNACRPLYIDIHALQTVPPNNMNRDDTGSPKTARFGGVVRQRVSSQAWKKAIRDEFAALLEPEELGQRTKDVVGLIADGITSIQTDIQQERALELAKEVLLATGVTLKKGTDETKYLLFMSRSQAWQLAELAVQVNTATETVDEKDLKKRAKSICNVNENPNLNAIDIALFGRMLADAPDLNVDAAVQVAHAIGINRAELEFDYFTALDDRQPEDATGAAMIETTEFLSSTLYRYATLDVYHLYENLGSKEVTCKAIAAFLQAFIAAMPTGKQNSFANRTLPSAIVVQLRSTQPVSLANAFEKPVVSSMSKGTIAQACDRLVKQEKYFDEAFGVAPDKTYVILADEDAVVLRELATEEAVSVQELISGIHADTFAYLDTIKG